MPTYITTFKGITYQQRILQRRKRAVYKRRVRQLLFFLTDVAALVIILNLPHIVEYLK